MALVRRLIEALPQLQEKLPGVRLTEPAETGPADLIGEVKTPAGRSGLAVLAHAQPAPGRIRESIRQLRLQSEPQKRYPILASWFLSPRVRQICREEASGYWDLAGNCFFQLPGFYVERVVETNPFTRPGRPASIFSAKSSLVSRALLEEPDRVWTLQELSDALGISLGQASNVTRRMIDEGYLQRQDRRLRLLQPASLLDAWKEAYSAPSEPPAAYYSFEREPARLMAKLAELSRAQSLRYAVTSFGASGLLAPFVHGVGALCWYVENETQQRRWVEALGLRPAEAGANALMRIANDAGVWYRTQSVDGITVASSIQVYFDLLHEAGRGLEQAEFLRKEKIKF